ncbi:MAG: hypothetical protein Q7S84_03835 [bacterium]|nr:hypothetical protein [bacterium]
MNSAVVYVVRHAAFHVGEFLRHWYVHSMRIYWNGVVNRLQALDHTLAWRVTLQNLFQPLYKDYSVIGYVLGFLFRIGRLAAATAVYAVLLSIAVVVYAVWLGIPPTLLFLAFAG